MDDIQHRSSTPRGGDRSLFTLRDYLERLRKGRAIVFAFVLLVPLVALLASLLQPKVYRSETQILVKPLPVQRAANLVSAPLVNLETERRLVYSDPVLGGAIERLGAPTELGVFDDAIDVTPLPQTELLVIGFTGESPSEARAGAAAVAASYLEFRAREARGDLMVVARGLEEQLELARQDVSSIEDEIAKSLSRIRDSSRSARSVHLLEYKQLLKQRRSAQNLEARLEQELASLNPERSVEAGVGSVVEPADLPTEPASPRPLLNLFYGIVAGLILGVCAALVFYSPVLRKELAVA